MQLKFISSKQGFGGDTIVYEDEDGKVVRIGLGYGLLMPVMVSISRQDGNEKTRLELICPSWTLDEMVEYLLERFEYETSPEERPRYINQWNKT